MKQQEQQYTYEIDQDMWPDSPRDWDNLWTLHFGGRRGHEIADSGSGVECREAKSHPEQYIVKVVHGYDHGGIGLSLDGNQYPFNCPWDSFVGVAIVAKAKIRKAFAVKRVTQRIVEQALANLADEIATYNQYLTGDVWCNTIRDAAGEVVDSVCGLYGREYAEQVTKDDIAYLASK